MKLQESLNRMKQIMGLIVEAYNEDDLKKIYLEKGLVDNKTFENVLFNFEKPFYRNWLLKRISENIINSEDIKDYVIYFDIFEKKKKKYPIKDLGLIKTEEEVRQFEEISREIIESEKKYEISPDFDPSYYVSKNDIYKLNSVGIRLVGMTKSGYQVFEIPSKVSESYDAFNMYRSILGKCSGRELGKTVKFCTIASQTQFQNYLIGGNLYVFFNLKDEDSPYQLWKADYRSHFQFMNNQNKEGENLKCDSIKYLYDKNLIDLDNKLKTECGFEFKNDGALRTDNLKNFVKDFIALGHNNPTLEMFFNIFGGIMSLNKIHLDSKSDKKYRAIDKSIVFITYEVAKEYMGIDKSYAPIVYDLVIDYYSKENMPATTYRAKKDEVVQMIENNEIPDYVMDTINTFLDEQR